MTHRPSYAPILMAFGLMFLLWGAVTSWVVSAAGLILAGMAGVQWLRDAAAEPPLPISQLQQQERAARVRVGKEAHSRSEFRMANPWLNRCAILLSIATFALVIGGALLTSYPNGSMPALQQVHLGIAVAVGILTIVVALGVGGTAWILLAAVAAQAVLGIWSNPSVAAFHALLAQFVFAGTVALAFVTAPAWRQPPEQIDDLPRLPLRKLSVVTLALLVIQVSLGAAYRHQVMGVVPHIANALVVTIAILVTAICVTNQYPEHRALRPVAKTLIGITFTQVMLGMGAFITRLMMAQGTAPVVTAGVLHVATGALTLAAMTVLTLMIRRYLRPAEVSKQSA